GHASRTCGTGEALMAARVAGPLEPSAERRLLEHLESCAACMGLARELEAHEVQEALAGTRDEKLLDLRVVAVDEYVRAGEIGRGGMGRVLRARDRRLGREVAHSLAILERRLGVNHPWVARCLGNMSSVLQYTGKYEEAL